MICQISFVYVHLNIQVFSSEDLVGTNILKRKQTRAEVIQKSICRREAWEVEGSQREREREKNIFRRVHATHYVIMTVRWMAALSPRPREIQVYQCYSHHHPLSGRAPKKILS